MSEIPRIAISVDTSKNVSNQDEEVLRRQVMQFLSSWLIDMNIEKAIDSFSTKIFSNKAIFDEDCSGLPDENRNSSEALKNYIEYFLKEVEDLSDFGDLNAALNMDRLLPIISKQAKSKTINPVVQDKFLLLRVNATDIAKLSSKKESRKFIKEYFKLTQPLYLSIIAFGDDYGGGIVNFVWENDDGNWKISHASIPFCM